MATTLRIDGEDWTTGELANLVRQQIHKYD